MQALIENILEAKIKVIQTRPQEDESGVLKGWFTFRKADRYKDVTWAWAKKRFKGLEKIRIRVTVWSPDGQQAHGLHQDFTPDSKAAAVRYAKKLVADGEANLATVEGQVWVQSTGLAFRDGWSNVITFGWWEPEK